MVGRVERLRFPALALPVGVDRRRRRQLQARMLDGCGAQGIAAPDCGEIGEVYGDAWLTVNPAPGPAADRPQSASGSFCQNVKLSCTNAAISLLIVERPIRGRRRTSPDAGF